MNVRNLVARAVVFTVDWVLIVGWLSALILLLVLTVFAGLAGSNMLAGITIGTAMLAFIYFSLATGVWFLLGMVLDYLKDIKTILTKG